MTNAVSSLNLRRLSLKMNDSPKKEGVILSTAIVTKGNRMTALLCLKRAAQTDCLKRNIFG